MKKVYVISIIGIILSIAFGIHFDNGWFGLPFLFFIAMGNIARVIEENRIWNNGICAKYNEPWEYVGSEFYTETSSVYYKCHDQHFSASPRDHFVDTYKFKI